MNISNIKTKEELSGFILLLRKNILENEEDFENISLDRFLEALAAWLIDMDKFYANREITIEQLPTWNSIAEMMYAAAIYE